MVPDVVYRYVPFPAHLMTMHVVQYAPGQYVAVFWDGVTDDRSGHRAFVRFSDGSSSLVLMSKLATRDHVPVVPFATHPPQCVALGCGNGVKQGLCPDFGGRRTACCKACYTIATKEQGFVHPGFIG